MKKKRRPMSEICDSSLVMERETNSFNIDNTVTVDKTKDVELLSVTTRDDTDSTTISEVSTQQTSTDRTLESTVVETTVGEHAAESASMSNSNQITESSL